MEVMTLSREELERIALMAVCACDYYELVDNLDSTTEEELWRIVDNRDDCCANCG